METQFIQLREQIQEDIITFCDGMDNDIVTKLCQIVCDNFRVLNED
jgi:hypothetical protein